MHKEINSIGQEYMSNQYAGRFSEDQGDVPISTYRKIIFMNQTDHFLQRCNGIVNKKLIHLKNRYCIDLQRK